MDFQKIKNTIHIMQDDPGIILGVMNSCCYAWWPSVLEIEHILENYSETNIITASEETNTNFFMGLMMLPAIMLGESTSVSWEVYEAIILFSKAYNIIINNKQLASIIESLEVLLQTKDSWRAILIQCESLMVQSQSITNANVAPYNLSRKFLTSLIEKKNLEGKK